jgi:hypothetical protein
MKDPADAGDYPHLADPQPFFAGDSGYHWAMDQSDIPLKTAADIFPRARHRFTYCAVGLIIGLVLTGLFRGWIMVLHIWLGALIIVLAVPAVGAYLDWRRLQQQSQE